MSKALLPLSRLIDGRPLLRSYSAGMVGTAIGRAATIVGGFASLFILTRLLGKAEIGTYGFALSAIQLLAILPSLGLERSLLYRLSRAEGTRDDELVEGGAVRQAILITAAVSTATVLLLSIAAEPIGALSIEGAASWVRWLAPSVLGIAATAIVATWFRARARLATATILPYTSEIARPVFFALVFLAGLGSSGIAAAVVAASLVPVAAGLMLVPRSAWNTVHRLERADFVYGCKVLFARFTNQLTKRISVLLLGFFGTAAATGDFLVAAAVAVAADLGSEALLPAASPSLARRFKANDRKALAREYDLTRRIGLGISLAVGAGYFLFGPLVLGLFGDYASALPALLILWFAFTVQIGFGLNAAYLAMAGFPGRNLVATATSLAVQCLSSALLIPGFGASGAATGLLLSILAANVVSSTMIYRLHGFRCLSARSVVVLLAAGAPVPPILFAAAPVWSGTVGVLLAAALLFERSDVSAIGAFVRGGRNP